MSESSSKTFVEQVMEYIENENVAEIGDDLYMTSLPSSPDIAAAIRPTGGPEADVKLKYDSPTVQVTTRSDGDPRNGYELAKDIYDVLHGFAGVLIAGGYHVVSCYGIQSEPADIGRDENNRVRYSQNYQFEIERTSKHRNGA